MAAGVGGVQLGAAVVPVLESLVVRLERRLVGLAAQHRVKGGARVVVAVRHVGHPAVTVRARRVE